ncbi:hypothetical protein PPERSA_04512 [Pseudocohnilembus persalinus]|uniref:Uncharacterized protein n=1 Tax=Pseudocohnilembus persalinus TaxID=266149 RepID=A0A0V0QSY9_PSEPJ|nr:hypothetical protein PPERSA_04512 [Pseudocohnilembus persalinus]|eukprot:KRX05475.1 hypothetical protein PPERSA_04512 [Pseudocohnilembus persalinus]
MYHSSARKYLIKAISYDYILEYGKQMEQSNPIIQYKAFAYHTVKGSDKSKIQSITFSKEEKLKYSKVQDSCNFMIQKTIYCDEQIEKQQQKSMPQQIDSITQKQKFQISLDDTQQINQDQNQNLFDHNFNEDHQFQLLQKDIDLSTNGYVNQSQRQNYINYPVLDQKNNQQYQNNNNNFLNSTSTSIQQPESPLFKKLNINQYNNQHSIL